MGESTVALGEQIIQARVAYNGSLAIQGPRHPSTVEADTKLRDLMQTARTLFQK